MVTPVHKSHIVSTMYSSCQLYVPNHDSNPASVDGTQIGILEEVDKVGFCSLSEIEQSQIHGHILQLYKPFRCTWVQM